MLSILFVGFLLGMRHALEADHVMAVASLASREHSLKKVIHLGAAWGVGHTLTLFIVVTLVLQLGDGLSGTLTHSLEMVVGFMLVVLGVDVLRRLMKERMHLHIHDHDGDGGKHFHAHSHRNEGHHSASAHNHKHNGSMSWRALAVGLMHGLAGSAALVVLTAATTESLWLGMAYAALFGGGSILGMALLSTLIALPFGLWGQRLSRFHNGAMMVIGLTTIVMGGVLLVNNAIESNLFT